MSNVLNQINVQSVVNEVISNPPAGTRVSVDKLNVKQLQYDLWRGMDIALSDFDDREHTYCSLLREMIEIEHPSDLKTCYGLIIEYVK